MKPLFKIRTLEKRDIERVTSWSRKEGFAPGLGDVNIYKNNLFQPILLKYGGVVDAILSLLF